MGADDRHDAAPGAESTRDLLRARAKASGRLVVPPEPDESPSWADVVAAGMEAGSTVSAALAAERAGA